MRHLAERQGGDNQARRGKDEYGQRSLKANCFNTVLAGAAKKVHDQHFRLQNE